jgi:hypothetical protein
LTRTCHLRRLGDDEGRGDLVFFDLPGSILDGATFEEAIANGADARTTD